MSSIIICDGCERPLEVVNGWIVHAIRISEVETEDGEEIHTDVCDGCLVKMKWFKMKKD